jgi:hypothetical protein
VGLEFLAGLAAIPEISISDVEAREITDAAADVLSHYNLTLPDGPLGAWMGLASVLAPIVGAHYVAYRLRTAAATAQIRGLHGHPAGSPPGRSMGMPAAAAAAA